DVLPVGLAFFETMKIALLDGREFTQADLNQAQASEAKMAAQRAEIALRLKSGEKAPAGASRPDVGPPVPLIVNQAFVRKYFATVNPLGQRFAPGDDPEDVNSPTQPGWEIVGVVRDAKNDRLQREIAPTMYIPNSAGSVWFALRTAGAPEGFAPS